MAGFFDVYKPQTKQVEAQIPDVQSIINKAIEEKFAKMFPDLNNLQNEKGEEQQEEQLDNENKEE